MDTIRDQDRLLPLTNVVRVMKQALPENAKISKEAKVLMQDCVSEFIGFVTDESCEVLKKGKRKTITCEDLVTAVYTAGFTPYHEYLETYRLEFQEFYNASRGIKRSSPSP